MSGDTRPRTALEHLGWRPFFAAQIEADAVPPARPVRVVAVNRSGLEVLGDGFADTVPPGPQATVGDWLLLDRDAPAQSRVLERQSLFRRRAPGFERRAQLIAANVDTAFIVTSCNADFNIARLERYAALAFDAEVVPVILLTKPDLCADPESYIRHAATVSPRVAVVAVDARAPDAPAQLAPWCTPGQTVAFMGSSGVGKSTLVNTLLGADLLATAGIREGDARGRHTTTRRALFFTPAGCAVLDTPGMREIQVSDVGDGIADVFDDLAVLEPLCKFRDCQHESEPGCAVQAAVAAGTVDPARLKRWRKLVLEDRFNSESLSERRMGDKAFGKVVRAAVKSKARRR